MTVFVPLLFGFLATASCSAGHPVARVYSWSDSQLLGDTIPLREDSKGLVGQCNPKKAQQGRLLLVGWAVDKTTGRPVDQVLVFLNRKLCQILPLDRPRPNLTKRFPAAGKAGFFTHLPLSDVESADLEVVAVSRGRYFSLPLKDWKPKGKTASSPAWDGSGLESIKVVSGCFQGEVRHQGRDYQGWAVDVENGAPAETIAVILNSKRVANLPLTLPSHEIALRFGNPLLEVSGFRYQADSDAPLQFVALRRGRGELLPLTPQQAGAAVHPAP